MAAPEGRVGLSHDRQHALDGLRGLAALAVVIGHCNLAATGAEAWGARLRDFGSLPASTLAARLFHVVAPADAAVTLFSC